MLNARVLGGLFLASALLSWPPTDSAKTSRQAATTRGDDPAEDAALHAPLLGPVATADETDWAIYLFKAFDRVDPDCVEGAPSVIVLRAPDASDYKTSEAWVGDALTGKGLSSDIIMFASPASPENLIKVLTVAVRKLTPNALKQSRIYVTVPAVYSASAIAALAPTGATVIYLDPARPVAEPKDRVACRMTSPPPD